MDYKEIVRYVANKLKGEDYEIDKALDVIDNYRCPITQASDEITNLIEEAISDYCWDNNYNLDDFYENMEESYDDLFYDALSFINDNVNESANMPHKVLSVDEAEKKLDELSSKYVPYSGVADTVGGEILRAFARLYYRCWNDGDIPFEGYGNETCNSSYRFLCRFSFFEDRIKYVNDDRWLKTLEDMMPDLYFWLTEGKGKEYFEIKNTFDSRKPSEEDLEWERYEDFYDDEDEW